MPGRFEHHYGPGGHRIGLLLLLVGIAVAVALVTYFLTARRRPHPAAPVVPPPYGPPPAFGAPFHGGDRAVELARQRYAQGDISRETYLQIVGDLTGQPVVDVPPPNPPAP